MEQVADDGVVLHIKQRREEMALPIEKQVIAV